MVVPCAVWITTTFGLHTMRTVFQAFRQGASSSSITDQTILQFFVWSGGDVRAAYFACNITGRFCWDNDHFAVVPSFPVSQLNDVGNIVGMLVWGWRWEIHVRWRCPLPEPQWKNWKLHKDGSGIPNIFAGTQQQCYRKCLGKSFRTSGAAIAAQNFILAPGAPKYWNRASKQFEPRPGCSTYGPVTSDENQDGRLFKLCEAQEVPFNLYQFMGEDILPQLFLVLRWIQ